MILSNMSRSLLVLAIILISLLAIRCENEQQESIGEVTRASFKLPRFFQFDWFTKEYNKIYPDLSEYVLRKKIYLGNLMHIFVSQLAFKHERSSYYLKVNEMSDRSRDEIRKLYSNPLLGSMNLTKIEDLPWINILAEPKTNTVEETDHLQQVIEGSDLVEEPLSDLSPEVVDDLKEIIEHQDESEALKTVAQELGLGSGNPQHTRRKRSTSSGGGRKKMRSWVKNLWGSSSHSSGQFSASISSSSSDGFGRSDLRRTRCFNRVKDQGDCGSCYIFSTLAMLEFQHCQESGRLIDLSEQFVLDCGYTHHTLLGCNGGSPEEVIEFFNERNLEIQRNYPYTAKVEWCPYEYSHQISMMGSLLINEQRMIDVGQPMAERLLSRVPVLVALMVAPDYHQYGGGVHNPGSNCVKNDYHSVIAVGKGREDGLDYYLLRDSHSTGFGESGYYKLARDSAEECIYGWSITEGLINGGEITPLIRGPNPNFQRHMLSSKG